ncbi:putative HET-domain-containing protein [Seiridium cardinale]
MSHRWTMELDENKLKIENHAAYKRSIPVEMLPKRYIDAIAVTWRLDIRYLWIDFLCIVQDDGVDLPKELGIMKYIYENACCNLAASSAIDFDEGLFYDRDRMQLPHLFQPRGAPKPLLA